MTQKPAAAPALASATLAQVYIQQDHLEQARRMLARVLQADPFHGNALALSERLAARSRARLYAGVRPGRGLAVRWHDAEGAQLHLVLAVFRKTGPETTTVHITSAPCLAAASEHHFTGAAAAPGPATATLCLARWDGQRLQPIAVHEPLSW
jgi:hypothetical protein